MVRFVSLCFKAINKDIVPQPHCPFKYKFYKKKIKIKKKKEKEKRKSNLIQTNNLKYQLPYPSKHKTESTQGF
jgi:hypothetical protein